MGWTTLHRDKGMTDREFFEAEFPEMLTKRGKIVTCASKNGAFYAAVRNHDDAPYMPGKTWALVVLIQRTRGYYNFGYKEMSEDMGPGADEAPAGVLDKLSPTDNQHALEWRAACRKNLAKRENARQVKAGTVVRFAQPIKFTNGGELNTFRYEGPGNTFKDIATTYGLRYNIARWRDRAFEVVSA